MKNLFKEQVEYLRENPEGYWFRRKLYGYGWTPATREGWLVTLVVFGFVVLNALRFERGEYPEAAILEQVLLPSILAVMFLLFVCIKKGEPAKWQWGTKPDDRAEDSPIDHH